MATKKLNKPKQAGKAPRATEPKHARVKASGKRATAEELKPRTKSSSRSASTSAAELEQRLRKTVAELGLTKARQIFESVEQAFGE